MKVEVAIASGELAQQTTVPEVNATAETVLAAAVMMVDDVHRVLVQEQRGVSHLELRKGDSVLGRQAQLLFQQLVHRRREDPNASQEVVDGLR